MGVYSDGNIYGILFTLNNSVLFESLFEKLTSEHIQEVKDYYGSLSDEVKNKIKILFYRYCSSSYNIIETSKFMSWFPGNNKTLEKLIDNTY
jgi:hypothetical protein